MPVIPFHLAPLPPGRASALQPRRLRLLALAAGLSLCCALAAYGIVARYELGALDRQLEDRLTLTRHAVLTEIARFRSLPRIVAEDARVQRLLAADAGPARAEANAYLERLRDLSGVDELYLLDRRGLTIASSNWNRPDGFMGQNYAFRPYFTQAMTTGEGRYYAVGVTTGKPGYFLSSRVGTGDAPGTGVVVAKLDMAPLEATWVRADEAVALAGPLGIVFLSGQRDWRYRPLTRLSPGARATLAGERRYGTIPVAEAPPLLTPNGRIASRRGEMRLARATIEPDGWQLLVAAPVARLREVALMAAGLATLASALAAGLALVLWQRRQIVRLRLDEARVLEARVAERTQALAREVEERRQAQAALQQTHASLVHAAKLAVLGRMSATVVHEVSQPLSALDATLAAAELHLARGATERAAASIGAARGLLRRMQDMVKSLRRFGARQRPEPPVAVDIAQALAGAGEVLAPRLRELGITLAPRLPAGLPPVAGSASQLSQVLANLVLNAAEATAAAGRPAPVTVTARLATERLQLVIADRGSGIDPGLRETVFEPFYSGRTGGEGLGLGLAIVRTILEHMGARLDFADRPGGGTEAMLDLPLFAPAALTEQPA